MQPPAPQEVTFKAGAGCLGSMWVLGMSQGGGSITSGHCSRAHPFLQGSIHQNVALEKPAGLLHSCAEILLCFPEMQYSSLTHTHTHTQRQYMGEQGGLGRK